MTVANQNKARMRFKHHTHTNRKSSKRSAIRENKYFRRTNFARKSHHKGHSRHNNKEYTNTLCTSDTTPSTRHVQWTIPFLAKRRYLATLYVLVIRTFQSDFEKIVLWIANKMHITCHRNDPVTS